MAQFKLCMGRDVPSQGTAPHFVDLKNGRVHMWVNVACKMYSRSVLCSVLEHQSVISKCDVNHLQPICRP